MSYSKGFLSIKYLHLIQNFLLCILYGRVFTRRAYIIVVINRIDPIFLIEDQYLLFRLKTGIQPNCSLEGNPAFD